VAASGALIATTAIGVLAGAVLANVINPRHLSYVAGVGFIVIGVWTLWRA
jgi:putative Ca2+/H+ antiporter (TMEM165/GDT1 family)